MLYVSILNIAIYKVIKYLIQHEFPTYCIALYLLYKSNTTTVLIFTEI